MTATEEAISARGAVPVVLVAAPDCHLCEHARAVLADLGRDYSLDVSEIERDSTAGTTLLTRFRPPFLPLLLIDGQRFGHGRISRRKLQRHLAGLVPHRDPEV